MVHCRLEGPGPWICKDFNGFGGSQALDLEGFQWIWRVPGLGFRMSSMDLEGIRPWIWDDFDGFGGFQALDLEGLRWIWRVPGLGFEDLYGFGGPQPHMGIGAARFET